MDNALNDDRGGARSSKWVTGLDCCFRHPATFKLITQNPCLENANWTSMLGGAGAWRYIPGVCFQVQGFNLQHYIVWRTRTK